MKLPIRIALRTVLAFIAFLPLLMLLPDILPSYAGATLNNLSDTISNMNSSGSATHSYSFKVTSTTAITSISITASTAWGSTPPTAGWVVKDNATTETVGSPTTSTTVIT